MSSAESSRTQACPHWTFARARAEVQPVPGAACRFAGLVEGGELVHHSAARPADAGVPAQLNKRAASTTSSKKHRETPSNDRGGKYHDDCDCHCPWFNVGSRASVGPAPRGDRKYGRNHHRMV